MADGERHDLVSGLGQFSRGLFDTQARSADDGLAGAVDVGEDDVLIDAVDDGLDVVEGREDRNHEPVVGHVDVRHLTAPAGHGLEGVLERERPRGDERPVLAEAVAHHHVGVNAVRGEHGGERRVDGEHCGLGDLRLTELLVGGADRFGVLAIDVDVVGERLAEDRGHHPVGFGDEFVDDRLDTPDGVQHVDVL